MPPGMGAWQPGRLIYEYEYTENRRASRLPDRHSPDWRSGHCRAPASLHGARHHGDHEFCELLFLRQDRAHELQGAGSDGDRKRRGVRPRGAHGARSLGAQGVGHLRERMGLPMPKLWIIPDDSPNAFATGRNPSHASLAFTAGLLRLMADNELKGVIAP